MTVLNRNHKFVAVCPFCHSEREEEKLEDIHVWLKKIWDNFRRHINLAGEAFVHEKFR